MATFQLKTSCIDEVPLQSYNKDFTFIVNGEEFHTSKVESDLLSTKINKIHLNDPTFDNITINTHNEGNFSEYLQLLNFSSLKITKNQLDFFIELFEILGTDHFNIDIDILQEPIELTNENVFSYLKEHSKHKNINKKLYNNEIEFISSHLNEIIEKQKEEFLTLDISTILEILNNEHIQLRDEDQLLEFVNEMYNDDKKYSIFYEEVLFVNVSTEKINEFISIFDKNDLSENTWLNLCERLKMDIKLEEENYPNRYLKQGKRKRKDKMKGITIPFTGNNEFKGIISYLRNESKQNIENSINVTSSSIYNNNQDFSPIKAVLYEENNKDFGSDSIKNSWICIDFKEHRIQPTHYTIKSGHIYPNLPRNWVIECSNDNDKWEIVDEETNNSTLRNNDSVHTFEMNKQNLNEYRYIRMRNAGPDWCGSYFIFINSIEFYGKLI